MVNISLREIYWIKRKRLKITTQEIADAIGVNRTNISRYENNKSDLRKAAQYRAYIDKVEKTKNI
ncbi:hypothetical protein BED47_00685 [Gottfriedia luciferensis]|uniref:HTH cro/C1-type domain-containing protein n=1 Tax=Gottfriedia luciferensis TaxID=178774 RepID=A0ABX2ZZA3_9BACI|nr:helix-turn-helix transcriptional regulator [Gottfriedia luciferensis]ODG93719.1 hypothetical protein BED47_00685 [Gottfriedia luciferensis]